MGKTISIDLSVKSIDRAIERLKQYRTEVAEKANILRLRVADRIAESAGQGFAVSVVDDEVGIGGRSAQVSVTVKDGDNVTVVVASGEDAVWCEFGAGVFHNGSVGSSPHPNGEELGMTIGSYGKGFGRKRVWGYYDDDGALHLTHGTPASMPMYNAMLEVSKDIYEIAREVFA